MIYGYLRVSSDEQDVNSQKPAVVKFAEEQKWTIDEFITDEGVSGGKDPDKRNLGPLLKIIKKGDIIICSEISRLGRDLYMVMDILHFCMEQGAKIYTVKDKFVLGDDIQSKVLAFAFGLSAEIERNLISQRTKEALARKKAEGVVLGRPRGKKSSPDKYKLSGKEVLIKELLKNGTSKRKIPKICKCDRNTLDRFITLKELAVN